MKRVKLTDLSEPDRSFLVGVGNGRGLVVEDDSGRALYAIIPYEQATPEQIAEADAIMERLWAKTSQAMKDQRVTVEDVERIVFEQDGSV